MSELEVLADRDLLEMENALQKKELARLRAENEKYSAALDSIAMAFIRSGVPFSGEFSFRVDSAAESARAILEKVAKNFEKLKRRQKYLKCPKCDDGFAGFDCTDEAISCDVCDGQGRITVDAHVNLVGRFHQLKGDAWCDNQELQQSQKALEKCTSIIKKALVLKEKYRTENARLKSAHAQMEQELNTLRDYKSPYKDECDEAGVLRERLDASLKQSAELVRLIQKIRDYQFNNHCPCESCHKICLEIDAAIAKHGEGER